jgi:hypothetical protein
MIRLIGLWLVGCALCVTPVAADEDMHDGPTAIKAAYRQAAAAALRPAKYRLRLRASVLPGEGWTRGLGSRRGEREPLACAEAADDAVMARYVLQLGGLGFVRTKTLKAFPEAAYREIIRSLG